MREGGDVANGSVSNASRELAEDVVANRSGAVLIKNTILKADHFPGCQNKNLIPNIDGAPNFRQVEALPVYGVAVPTVVGLRIVLDILGANEGRRKVLWHNMREEPLLYIHGKPYVVREADKPFANLEYTGIDRTRVEEMEERLKQDVLREAAQYEGQILLAIENDDFEVVEYWEEISPASVQTPQEVYKQMAGGGYDVDYLRVPVTDEKAPKESDCELLTQRCWDPPAGAALVFNCQMGRGRTTTGMIIASLLQLRRRGAFPVELESAETEVEDVPEWFKSPSPSSQNSLTRAELLRSGMYGVVRSLLRTLKRGKEGKHSLDKVINACSAMQNLRDAILTYRDRMTSENNERKRNALLGICLEYLERYCVLLAYTSFLSHPKFEPESTNFVGFVDFMKGMPEFKSVLQRLLRLNPLAALGLHKTIDMDTSGKGDNEQDAEDNDEMGDANPSREIIAKRSGKVLLQCTVLKEDHFPGIQKEGIPQLIEGAPNFRQAPGLPVFGVALPTVEGIKRVLDWIKDAHGDEGALVCNMREEPVVYISGRPFVLREEARPFKNLREYSGIDARRLEEMESRLKQDILEEAKMYGGRIVVVRETPSGRSIGYLVDKWEEIKDEDTVQTPAEVYSHLKKNGYSVDYCRVPVTDGTPPAIGDVDTLARYIRSVKPETPLLFNCHNGAGRTTTGMVIGALLKMKNVKPALLDAASAYALTGLPSNMAEKLAARCTSEDSDVDEMEANNSAGSLEDNLDIEDPAEYRACLGGAFLAVRRLVRLLGGGPSSKEAVDRVIDACGLVVNLRTAIMRYRKPHRGHRRPETQNRHRGFKRGVSYLERYCMMITFGAYLDVVELGSEGSFKSWINARGDVRMALDSIGKNPGSSLSTLPETPQRFVRDRVDEQYLPTTEEQQVMSTRQGSALSRKTILKSYHTAELVTGHHSSLTGAPDVRHAQSMPVYTVGNPSVEGMRRLLSHFEAGPSGSTHVVISDIREELVVYVSGRPYTRRDLERPVSSLNHVGVTTEQLERLENALKEDVGHEAERFGGKMLLHREVLRQDLMHGQDVHSQHGWHNHMLGTGNRHDDITYPSDDPLATIVGFWKNTEVSCDLNNGICTPQDIHAGLLKEGFKVSYGRIPLSRERMPDVGDIDLLQQVLRPSTVEGSRVVHLILSRTATGSSSRFCAALFCSYLSWGVPGISATVAPLIREPDNSENQRKTLKRLALGEYRGIMNLCRVLPDGLKHKQAVDEAIDCCQNIGSLREDILSCKYFDKDTHELDTEVMMFGLHYLQRYFLLIAFRCYLDNRNGAEESFMKWVADRKELMYLLKTLSLE